MAAKNEWTLLFFLAGDNELSPLMIAELKAIKDAGFQLNTSVLVHFDPNPLGAPTRIYNVNRRQKAGASKSRIGDGRSRRGRSFVPNLVEDFVGVEEIDPSVGEASAALRNALNTPDSMNVGEALKHFLGYARENHPAEHYILFLHGHGLVVANDTFLPDSNPPSGLSLRDLEDGLRPFSDDVRRDGGEFELLAMHSCSMSSVEVAYQLKGTANYMIAAEGPSFVGGWPYRKLVLEAFLEIEGGLTRGASGLVEDLYSRSLFNGTDYMAAGYSSELGLCNLREAEVRQLDTPIKELVKVLKRALDPAQRDEQVTQLILLAHWKSQSYWQETFTDLFDFCQCLAKLCDPADSLQGSFITACEAVMTAISKQVVERSDAFGPAYQYSHGLSVYFPWSRPVEDVTRHGKAGKRRGILERYKEYAFTNDLGDDSWLSFLTKYFDATLRDSRVVEDGLDVTQTPAFRAARRLFKLNGSLSAGIPSTLTLAPPDKSISELGLGCNCPSIKNYPQEIVTLEGEARLSERTFAITEGALKAF